MAGKPENDDESLAGAVGARLGAEIPSMGSTAGAPVGGLVGAPYLVGGRSPGHTPSTGKPAASVDER